MKFEAPYEVLENCATPELKSIAAKYKTRYRQEPEPGDLVEVDVSSLPFECYGAAVVVAQRSDNPRAERALKAIIRAFEGDFDTPVPNFDAFLPMLTRFLREKALNGWVFREDYDGHLYPYLAMSAKPHTPARSDDGPPSVRVSFMCWGGISESGGLTKDTMHVVFEPSDVTRKKIPDILAASRLFVETEELLTAYDAEMDYYRQKVAEGFAQQYTFQGKPKSVSRWGGKLSDLPKRKVIHDVPMSENKAIAAFDYSDLLRAEHPIPTHPLVRVFDLADHEFFTTHASNLTPYEFDKTLRDKLILPESHRDLLDVLTTDLDQFLGDIVDGKSAGNIVICKGVPGVGKTLTAEIYSELIEKPMYSVHSGSLGTSASAVERNLDTIFQRQRRWGCVLLLDEADVFVVERGDNIEQNAIVAEFLRVLEYFSGLLFMTTNRPDSIDEAIISRAAAIIHYEVPGPVDRAKIWRVMFENLKQDVSDELIADLVDMFPTIAPRDIKMLLRLALRMSTFSGAGLTTDTFRRCAMFRNVDIASETDLV